MKIDTVNEEVNPMRKQLSELNQFLRSRMREIRTYGSVRGYLLNNFVRR